MPRSPETVPHQANSAEPAVTTASRGGMQQSLGLKEYAKSTARFIGRLSRLHYAARDQRNIPEHPGWYTIYSISIRNCLGRLEALLNFRL